jgi:hypothetical protein
MQDIRCRMQDAGYRMKKGIALLAFVLKKFWGSPKI